MIRIYVGALIIALPILIGIYFGHDLAFWPTWAGQMLIYSLLPCNFAGWLIIGSGPLLSPKVKL